MKKSLTYFCFTFILLIIGCKKDSLTQELEVSQKKIKEIDVNFSNTEAELITLTNKDGTSFSVEDFNDKYILEGDIILTESQVNSFRSSKDIATHTQAAPGKLNRRWLNSQVNFWIDIPARRADILWAINHIENLTNIDFRESRSGNYIAFVHAIDECSSNLGMIGGRQNINTSDDCTPGIIVHEILHALGFFHEQSRSDRNNTIRVNFNNVQNGRSSQFNFQSVENYGPFDINSIMMYGSCSFAIACLPFQGCNCLPNEATITTRNGGLINANRDFLSPTDINALNDMYPNFRYAGNSAYTVGANDSGDYCYAKKNGRFLEIYKNGIRVQRTRSTAKPFIDITSDGTILTSLLTFSIRSGSRRNYRAIDVSEGGGNIYYLATNGVEIAVFRKTSSSYIKEGVVPSAKRISVDGNGTPWVITSNKLYTKTNGQFTPVHTINTSNFTDIGCSGNNIFVSTAGRNNSNNYTYKYNLEFNILILQPGKGGDIDAGNNQTLWH